MSASSEGFRIFRPVYQQRARSTNSRKTGAVIDKCERVELVGSFPTYTAAAAELKRLEDTRQSCGAYIQYPFTVAVDDGRRRGQGGSL